MKNIIVALDFTNHQQAKDFVQKLDPTKCRVKVGKALFTLAGPNFIDYLHGLGFEVFLDLKFHDIPNTVHDACKVCAEMGVFMLTVHTLGGKNMLLAAQEGVDKANHANNVKTKIMGVTVLTSMDQSSLYEIGVQNPLSEQVVLLGGLADCAGINGLVCSAHEAGTLKEKYPRLELLTPGIRLKHEIDNNSKQDQKRVMTPREAIEMGSNYLVIGRSITKANEPIAVLDSIIQELS